MTMPVVFDQAVQPYSGDSYYIRSVTDALKILDQHGMAQRNSPCPFCDSAGVTAHTGGENEDRLVWFANGHFWCSHWKTIHPHTGGHLSLSSVIAEVLKRPVVSLIDLTSENTPHLAELNAVLKPSGRRNREIVEISDAFHAHVERDEETLAKCHTSTRQQVEAMMQHSAAALWHTHFHLPGWLIEQQMLGAWTENVKVGDERISTIRLTIPRRLRRIAKGAEERYVIKSMIHPADRAAGKTDAYKKYRMAYGVPNALYTIDDEGGVPGRILIVEGEKAAWGAAAMHLAQWIVTTTNGNNGWEPFHTAYVLAKMDYYEIFRTQMGFCEIVISPDNDTEGEVYRQAVIDGFNALRPGVGDVITVVSWPDGFLHKGDLYDLYNLLGQQQGFAVFDKLLAKARKERPVFSANDRWDATRQSGVHLNVFDAPETLTLMTTDELRGGKNSIKSRVLEYALDARPGPRPALLVRTPTGVGKTESVLAAVVVLDQAYQLKEAERRQRQIERLEARGNLTEGQQKRLAELKTQQYSTSTIWFGPYRRLIEELHSRLDRWGVDRSVITNVEARSTGEGESLCAFPQLVASAAEKGYLPMKHVCPRCGKRNGCKYLAQYDLLDRYRVAYLRHQQARMEAVYAASPYIVIDEDASAQFTGRVELDAGEFNKVFQYVFGPDLRDWSGAIDRAVGQSEEPVDYDAVTHHLRQLTTALYYLPQVVEQHLKLLAHRGNLTVEGDALLRMVDYILRGSVWRQTPEPLQAFLGSSAPVCFVLGGLPEVIKAIPPAVLNSLADFTPSNLLLEPDKAINRYAVSILLAVLKEAHKVNFQAEARPEQLWSATYNTRLFMSSGKYVYFPVEPLPIPEDKPVIIMDATGNPALVSQMLGGRDVAVFDPTVRDPRTETIIINKEFTKSNLGLTDNPVDKTGADPMRQLAFDLIKALAIRHRELIVITFIEFHPLVEAWAKEQGLSNVAVDHFGNVLAVNTYENHEALLLLGTPYPNNDGLRCQLKALAAAKGIHEKLDLRLGTRRPVRIPGTCHAWEVSGYGDEWAENMRMEIIRAQVVQAVGRNRPHTSREKRYTYSTVPLVPHITKIVSPNRLLFEAFNLDDTVKDMIANYGMRPFATPSRDQIMADYEIARDDAQKTRAIYRERLLAILSERIVAAQAFTVEAVHDVWQAVLQEFPPSPGLPKTLLAGAEYEMLVRELEDEHRGIVHTLDEHTVRGLLAVAIRSNPTAFFAWLNQTAPDQASVRKLAALTGLTEKQSRPFAADYTTWQGAQG